ncbi:6-phosphogluconolactonase [Mesobacterium sp. TK19101]|uniref:6-phosphogluconolactonase n=1 Tax=Mesobacterium hydrothermale TaxID=3111907 RepID=A0ABU6HMB2_9RHOB|nr:6-phosphogluconolactonase [Mesobacterium sp. TK19101]MEC3863049.1 6-phosphogluconolactonase [Mesobacterium sp. TK19101]
MTYEMQDYADREMLAINLANRIAGDLKAALNHQYRALLVVPGGTTPGPIFDSLCAADLDWARVDVMLGDERWLPEDSPRSNTRLLRERLLVDRARAARLLPLFIPADQPEDVLAELESQIVPQLPIAVLLLGMGADMHTASLFPGADNLSRALAEDAPVLMAMRAPSAPEPRITLTAPVLDAALKKHVVIFGQEKRDALEASRGLPVEQAPIRAVLDGATVHWAE